MLLTCILMTATSFMSVLIYHSQYFQHIITNDYNFIEMSIKVYFLFVKSLFQIYFSVGVTHFSYPFEIFSWFLDCQNIPLTPRTYWNNCIYLWISASLNVVFKCFPNFFFICWLNIILSISVFISKGTFCQK